MAPRPTAQRRSNAQSEAFHELGVRGRKTGVSLKDTGVRDEHGMQPLDDVFSSPDKESQNGVGGYDDDEEEEESEEEPMDIDETTGPAPSAFMNGNRFPPARGRSPPKTNLHSPAKRNPHLGHSSSPTRGSIIRHSRDGSFPKSSPRARPPQRKLNFNNKPSLSNTNGVNGKGKAPAVTNGHLSPDEDEEEPQPDEESMAMLDGNDDYAAEEEGEQDEPDADGEPEAEEEEPEVDGDETEEEVAAPVAHKPRGRPKKTAPIKPVEEEEPVVQSIEEAELPEEDEPAPASKKRGRPPKNKAAEEDAAEEPRKKKAKQTSNVAETEAQQTKGRKPNGKKATGALENNVASKTSASASASAKKPAISKQKRGPKPRTSTGAGDTSLAEVPRGPPLPKSRGLMITRRETPDGFTTRSGRTSYQPLKFWRNERVELDAEETFDDGKQHVLLPRIKEIVRVDEPEPDPKARRKSGRPAGKKGSKGKGRRAAHDSDDDDDELEPWEQDGDIIMGDVVVWQPEHELKPPGPDEQIEVAEEQLAVSSGAIVTREIRNASFRFAKTLSTPFFGAGVVDLPPHSEKKPKNARKMHMSFFVFSGRVRVTIAETTFRIGKGGMWFVPRGNYYSIENDYDQPARVMFSQGCEVSSGVVGDASMVG